ncbi:MAG: MarR family winged helix-turn-helix transcriptional regulator [Burkholderiaceae bacterium]
MSKNLVLDHQLCFAIYSANNSVIRAYKSELKKFGITYTQYLVLLVLWEVKNAPVNYIATRLKLDPGSLSPVLKRMQKSNLISKIRKKEDERSVIVTLTSQAKELEDEVAEIQQKVSCDTGLSASEYESLRDSVKELLENLDQENKKIRFKSVA